MESRLWPCPTCDDERAFVQPPCTDGHTAEGGECPDWACADCGTAFVVAAVISLPAALPVAARLAA